MLRDILSFLVWFWFYSVVHLLRLERLLGLVLGGLCILSFSLYSGGTGVDPGRKGDGRTMGRGGL